MKISIIIPVYNVINYLEDCINSILSSVEDNVELLLIDDGSTDGSGKIVDEYCTRYNFIKGYHKINGGLSDARNYGLHKAKGEYVIFIDSDDMVDSSNFKKLINKLSDFKSEVLLWDATTINEKSDRIISHSNDYYIHNGLNTNVVYSGVDAINCQISNHEDYVTTVWLGAYKKDYLIDNNLWFDKGLLHEDEYWTIKLLISAKSVEYLDEIIYLYRQREDSIMNKINKNYKKNITDIIYIYSSLYSYVDWKVENGVNSNLIKGNISRRYLHALAKFEVDRYKNEKKKINLIQLFKNCNRKIDKIRCLVLLMSSKIYCNVSNCRNNKIKS